MSDMDESRMQINISATSNTIPTIVNPGDAAPPPAASPLPSEPSLGKHKGKTSTKTPNTSSASSLGKHKGEDSTPDACQSTLPVQTDYISLVFDNFTTDAEVVNSLNKGCTRVPAYIYTHIPAHAVARAHTHLDACILRAHKCTISFYNSSNFCWMKSLDWLKSLARKNFILYHTISLHILYHTISHTISLHTILHYYMRLVLGEIYF